MPDKEETRIKNICCSFLDAVRDKRYEDIEKLSFKYDSLPVIEIGNPIDAELASILVEEPLDEVRLSVVGGHIYNLAPALILSTPNIELLDRVLVAYTKGRTIYCGGDTILSDDTLLRSLPEIQHKYEIKYPKVPFPKYLVVHRIIQCIPRVLYDESKELVENETNKGILRHYRKIRQI